MLVGTITIDKSELISKELKKAKIKHNVLNAKNHQQESEIIAQAGRLGAVTIATNMAGRGTDILLGGNPEFMAKRQMRALGYNDAQLEYVHTLNNSGNEDIFRILIVKRAELEKLSSLRWFNEINLSTLYTNSCKYPLT